MMIIITMRVIILMMMVVIIMTMKMMMMMKIIKYHENIAFFELQNTLTDGFRKKVLTPSLKCVLCVFGWEAVKVKVNLHYDQGN